MWWQIEWLPLCFIGKIWYFLKAYLNFVRQFYGLNLFYSSQFSVHLSVERVKNVFWERNVCEWFVEPRNSKWEENFNSFWEILMVFRKNAFLNMKNLKFCSIFPCSGIFKVFFAQKPCLSRSERSYSPQTWSAFAFPISNRIPAQF